MATYVFNIISLLGGLALFLFGMDIMGRSLERQAGSRLQTILAKMSSSVPKGFILGMAATAVIQSSSATTVMVVGFVNSGIMTLKQAVGVIMGSNVGTTVTAWILSLSGLEGDSFLIQIFKPTTLAPAIGVIGIVLFMFTKNESKKNIGMIMLGFMSLMTGMDIMGDSMAFLEEEAWFAELMISFSNPILGILFGAALTALIQSSSASVGILQGLSITGAVSFGAAIPIILGQNIGTCITALMGAIGANRNARRTAAVHLLFNILGVVIFAAVFYGIGLFAPWNFIDNPVAPWDISIIHTGFNLLATAILLPMNNLLVKLAYLVVPEKEAAEPEKNELLDERLMVTPSVAIQRAYEVAGQMAVLAEEAFQRATTLLFNFDTRVYDNVIELENETDHYEDALGTYMVKFSGKRLSVTDNRTLNTLLYSISDLERIADHAVAIAKAAKEMNDKGITFSHQAQKELQVLQEAVNAVVRRTATAFVHRDMNKAMKVEPQEQVVDSLVREIKSRHVRRLRDGLCTVESGFILEDMLTAFERTADHCSNVAVEMLQVAEGKLEAHEYLNALKAGELRESAKFSERFARYRSRYVFPEDEEV